MKKILSIVSLLAVVSCSNADSYFTVDGIRYGTSDAKTAYVTYLEDNVIFTGDIIIPSKVTDSGTTYSVTSIRGYAFLGCTGLTSIEIPNSVTSIGEGAFYGCTGLTSIEIPNSVTSIGDHAFYGCTGLSKVIWNAENCSSVPYSTFNGCSVTEFLFGDDVKVIPKDCCYGMSKLTSVNIPNGVTSIGGYAFSGCTGLTSIEIPNSVTSIGGYAFDGTPWFETFLDGLIYINNVAYKYRGEMPDNTKIKIKEGTVSISNYAFSGCTGLTSIEIPNSVTSIGYNAFSGCTGLTSIEIPNSVTSIGEVAFSGCTGLTSIEIPSSVTSIGYNAFYGCTGLTSIEIPNSVTSIGDHAFYGCTGLSKVIWNAENCSSVPYSTFNGCSVTELLFGDDVKVIPRYCCYGMSKLTSVNIPNGVTSIGGYAFSGCTGLTSIEIPNSVTSIGDHAFYGCTGLSKVIWNAENCSSVPYSTFNGCSVTEFLFGDDVKVIPKDCCYGMSKLTSVNIPNGVTSIGGYAFSGCTGLTSIEIPNSVTSIGGYAFSGCIGITAIGCNAEIPPTIGSLTFNGVDRSIPLSIPCENAMAYKNAKGWNEFSNLRCIDSGEPAFDPLGPNDRNYYHVVTINANGKRTTYRMSAIQKVTVEDKNVVRKTFKVDFTDKSKSVGDVRVIVSEFADEQEEVVEVETSDTSVTIKWSKVDGANSYKITICKDELCEHVICVLWFDANGNLIVEQPKSGYESGTSKSTKSLSYTVTGLTPGTMYNYSVQVFDTSNQLMIEETGEFSTEMSTAVDAANGSVQVYSVGKSIVVNSPTPCNIMFYDSVGRGLGECVVASHCRCTVTLPGVYIVIAGDKQYKIRVN